MAKPNKKNRSIERYIKYIGDTKPTNLTNCIWCNTNFSWEKPPHPLSRTKEHLIPEAMGGGWSLDNILFACYNCNHERGKITSFFDNAQLLYFRYKNEPHSDIEIKKTVKKIYRHMNDMLELQIKWSEIERNVMGISIHEALELKKLPIFSIFNLDN